MPKLTIHATNVTGLGASQVVFSLLEELSRTNSVFEEIKCYIPSTGLVSKFSSEDSRINVVKFTSSLPKPLRRTLECLLPGVFFDLGDVVVVLGDVPLRTSVPQVLFVHQPHLLKPNVNPYVSSRILYRFMRLLTAANSRYVSKLIVQTSYMGDALMRSYANLRKKNCVVEIGQPPPSWFSATKKEYNGQPTKSSGLKLFYPAAGYPHKNHKIFAKLKDSGIGNKLDSIVVTLDRAEFKHGDISWLKMVGRLNSDECLDAYSRADALFFPSVLESYGLPLIEAMTVGLPIIAADLPYARVLCGENAIYFDPESGDSAASAISELHQKLSIGWRPSWTAQLEKLPANWEEVLFFIIQQAEGALLSAKK